LANIFPTDTRAQKIPDIKKREYCINIIYVYLFTNVFLETEIQASDKSDKHVEKKRRDTWAGGDLCLKRTGLQE
jgi:hypothetical protein